MQDHGTRQLSLKQVSQPVPQSEPQSLVEVPSLVSMCLALHCAHLAMYLLCLGPARLTALIHAHQPPVAVAAAAAMDEIQPAHAAALACRAA